MLFVAFGWSTRKGLDVIIYLAEKLPEDYQVVVVGTNEYIDKIFPGTVISIRQTQDLRELVRLYTVADVFVNPTREEVLGMVNIEALACGTPVVTFRSGGSPECIDSTCGNVVETDDKEGMLKAIINICKQHPFREVDCIKRAHKFNSVDIYERYIRLYETFAK